MTRRPQEAGPQWVGSWPRTRLLPAADSDAARILKDALRRYLARELSGRAFLIAGHRGAGKTTMVRRAVAEVADETLDKLFNATKRSDTAAIDPATIRLIQQRPLLVPVHGPSLLLESLPGPAPADADAAASAEKPTPKQSFLVQISIALYRALAAECSAAFAVHGRAQGGNVWPEIAAQLQLALDEAPEPALLRTYWDRFDVLERGVFWPTEVGEAQAQAGRTGQGLREIVAVATAAQIYEVSTGRIDYVRTRKDSSRTEQTAGRAAADLLKRLPGFGAGALLGGGAAYGLDPAGQLTLPAALLGGLLLGGAGTLNRTRDSNLEYRVTEDRSEASLERTLPLAIERLREAGLAPVFLIDELDKLDKAFSSDLGKLLFNMKQLTTDYGFFCFLTDRDYFDQIQQSVELGIYPLEHSFFSARLYILHKPRDMDDFIDQTFDLVPGGPEQGAGLLVLKKLVLHRAKLNMLDAIRRLDEGWDQTPQELCQNLGYRLAAAVQLAIEHVMRDADLVERARQDGAFRQLLVDAMYIVSRAWEGDKPSVCLERADIARALLERRKTWPARRSPPDPFDMLRAQVGEADATLVVGAIRKLTRLLCDFSRLRQELTAAGGFSAGELDVLTAITPALLQQSPSAAPGESPPFVYTFAYDPFGVSRSEADGKPLDDADRQELAKPIRFVDNVRTILAEVGT